MDMQLDEVRELRSFGYTKAIDRIRPRLPLSRFKESSPSRGLGRLTHRLASARGIAPPLRERDSDSDCLRKRRRSFPLRGNDLLRPPTTIGHRPGLSRLPAVCRRRSDAVRL